MRRLLPLFCVLMSLAACQTVKPAVTSDITAFHRLTPGMAVGKTLAIEAFPPERQQSLEFATYRVKLAEQFANQGLIVLDKTADADWVAIVRYDVDNGRRESRTYSVPEYGQTSAGGTTYHSGTVGRSSSGYGSYSGTSYTPPTYGITGYSTNTVTTTRYTRTMTIDILDRPALDKGQTVKIYESKLVSSGSCGSLAPLFDSLVIGQFMNWPGESGKTQQVSVPWDGKC